MVAEADEILADFRVVEAARPIDVMAVNLEDDVRGGSRRLREIALGAMQRGAADRYFQDSEMNVDKLVPEGVEGRVAYKGSVVWVLQQLVGGVRASMGYTGCASVEELRTRARFVEITAAGMRESHVHDVQIVKEAPNYRAD